MRIVTRLNIGGPSIHVAILSTKLDPSRFSTCLVIGETEASEGDCSALVQNHLVHLIRVPTLQRRMSALADLCAWCAILKVLWRERPHIIHTHMAKAGTLGRLAGLCYNAVGPGRQTTTPRALLIHTFHGHVLDGYFSARLSQLFVTIERYLARGSDYLIAVSPAIRDDLLQRGIGQPDRWRVIRLGLDLSALAALPFGNGSRPVRCGFVGRLVPIKNPSLFLQALEQLKARAAASCARGVIVGDGALRQALEREAIQRDVHDIVHFTGWQHDLRAVYENLDIACVTSWNEGTPVSLIEAMAAGRTVVATDVGGVRDLLEETTTMRVTVPEGGFALTSRGALIRPGDAQGLAAALCALAADQPLRLALGRAAREHVVHTYRAQRLLEEVAELYEQASTAHVTASG